MTTALLAVDVQWDFISGPMGGPDRIEVVNQLLKLQHVADTVIATQDWHPVGHCSFENMGGLWPEHCVQGTEGAKLHADIEAIADYTIVKGTNPYLDAYSAFDNPKLDMVLKQHEVDIVIIGGLCTDYCVKAAALDAARLGYKTMVALPACRGVAPGTIAYAIKQMEAAGVSILRG